MADCFTNCTCPAGRCAMGNDGGVWRERITLRDELAAACLPAIYEQHTKLTDRAAELAYEQADEMLKARSTTR